MSPLAAPVVPGPSTPQYDPEVKAMADFIHNYKVDSDLAVRGSAFPHDIVHSSRTNHFT